MLTSAPQKSLTADDTGQPGLSALLLRCLLAATIIALFGQPNAFFVYFPPYPVVASLLLLLFFSFVVYAKVRVRPITVPRSSLIWPALIFFVYSVISLSYAPDPAFGARILFSALFKYLLFLAILCVCTEEQSIRKLLTVIVVLGGVFSLQGLVYVVAFIFFNLPPGDYVGAVQGYGSGGHDFGLNSLGILGFAKATNQIGGLRLPRCQSMFLEPSSLAEFLELSIFATLAWSALIDAERKKWVPWLLAVQFGALIFSFSSAGWLAIAVGMALYIGLRVFSRPGVISRRRLTNIITVTGVLLGVIVLLLVSFPSISSDVYKAVYTAKFVDDATSQTSSSDRVFKASDSIRLISQRPIFGWGTNQSVVVSAQGAAVGNAFLTTLTELGGVGLLIYLAMLGAIFSTAFYNMRRAYQSASDTMIAFTAALAGCVAASFIHSMLVDNEFVFSYWISLALIYVNRVLLLPCSALSASAAAPAGEKSDLEDTSE